MATFGETFDMQEMPIDQGFLCHSQVKTFDARAGAWSHRQPRRTDNLVISVTFLGSKNA
jgi:hypothetical protein